VALLDEPTVGLDDDHRRRLLRLIGRHLAAGRAVLAATHDAAVLRAAARVLVVREGSLTLRPGEGPVRSGPER
jgi:ABC-type transport system involved in cytochrome bd biosynthesis fused ATPase/permease subunit